MRTATRVKLFPKDWWVGNRPRANRPYLRVDSFMKIFPAGIELVEKQHTLVRAHEVKELPQPAASLAKEAAYRRELLPQSCLEDRNDAGAVAPSEQGPQMSTSQGSDVRPATGMSDEARSERLSCLVVAQLVARYAPASSYGNNFPSLYVSRQSGLFPQ